MHHYTEIDHRVLRGLECGQEKESSRMKQCLLWKGGEEKRKGWEDTEGKAGRGRAGLRTCFFPFPICAADPLRHSSWRTRP